MIKNATTQKHRVTATSDVTSNDVTHYLTTTRTAVTSFQRTQQHANADHRTSELAQTCVALNRCASQRTLRLLVFQPT